MDRWRGVLHHTINIHQKLLKESAVVPECEHGGLTDINKKLLEPDTDAHKTSTKAVVDTIFIHTLKHYVNFRHTGDNFHQHLLMYAAKRFLMGIKDYIQRGRTYGVLFLSKNQNYILIFLNILKSLGELTWPIPSAFPLQAGDPRLINSNIASVETESVKDLVEKKKLYLREKLLFATTQHSKSTEIKQSNILDILLKSTSMKSCQ
ncbi:hypothetical protein LOTGIDRAFT_172868 [Lottia gigantea]|uniref:Uncharacterized protein n=1 Tax=Lottia gigantea TaxID=225164 RepID=V4AAM3_LOTGI|nr:hypothetical protein LOTGIDRAFT_172868 [Lottia gigantea]ESP01034.1 hypothetical protein LOTGIDRAFT_172868 [Lottia gigantea]